MNTPSLENVKNQIRESYRGKGGIHAVGISRKEQAIRLYCHSQSTADADVLTDVRKSAEPFAVIVVNEERPVVN